MAESPRSIFERLTQSQSLTKLKEGLYLLLRGAANPSGNQEKIRANQPPPFQEQDIVDLLNTGAQEGHEPELSPEQQQIVINNVRKLYFDYIDHPHHADRSGLGGGDRSTVTPSGEEKSATRQYLTVTYSTDSGRVENRPAEFGDGDYSIFRTNTIIRRSESVLSPDGTGWEIDWNQNPTFTIELEYPKGGLSPVEWSQALEDGVSLDEQGRFVANTNPRPLSNRTIRPERLFPDMERNQQGEYVYNLRQFTPEDHLVLKSFVIFNRLYGENTPST